MGRLEMIEEMEEDVEAVQRDLDRVRSQTGGGDHTMAGYRRYRSLRGTMRSTKRRTADEYETGIRRS